MLADEALKAPQQGSALEKAMRQQAMSDEEEKAQVDTVREPRRSSELELTLVSRSRSAFTAVDRRQRAHFESTLEDRRQLREAMYSLDLSRSPELNALVRRRNRLEERFGQTFDGYRESAEVEALPASSVLSPRSSAAQSEPPSAFKAARVALKAAGMIHSHTTPSLRAPTTTALPNPGHDRSEWRTALTVSASADALSRIEPRSKATSPLPKKAALVSPLAPGRRTSIGPLPSLTKSASSPLLSPAQSSRALSHNSLSSSGSSPGHRNSLIRIGSSPGHGAYPKSLWHAAAKDNVEALRLWQVSYIHTHTHPPTHTHMYICIYTYMFIYIYIHIHIYMYIYIHTHTHTYMYICIYTYMFIYIYTYTYTYVHMYIYTYTYRYPHSTPRKSLFCS